MVSDDKGAVTLSFDILDLLRFRLCKDSNVKYTYVSSSILCFLKAA